MSLKNNYHSTRWSEQFKICLSKTDESMDLHDIIKILMVRKIIRNCKNKAWIRIYTEFSIGEKEELIPDIYVENIKDKSIICYEIQKNLGSDYVTKKTKQYNELDIPFFNSIDLIIIPIKNAPNDLTKLNSWLNQFIF
ncbi:MAG TPA: hypothetical protein VMZ91_13985 [Candidatus Paceibacterota bacterium]|nr:hypothetical protein [Candidatus Paceibacterota bacterium]